MMILQKNLCKSSTLGSLGSSKKFWEKKMKSDTKKQRTTYYKEQASTSIFPLEKKSSRQRKVSVVVDKQKRKSMGRNAPSTI